MGSDRTLEIVLGEAEPDAGILRMILEAEGFHIVGHASNDDELQRVLAWVRPAVIVLDGGISASAALGARERATSAALVVVWPPGVAAVVAEERVAPERVFDELGNAVRRASLRTEPGPIPGTGPAPARVRRAAAVPAVDGDPRRQVPSRRLGFVTAAAWILLLVALTTVAVAVPAALIRRERSSITAHDPGRSPIAERPSPASLDGSAPTRTSSASCGRTHRDRAPGGGEGVEISCDRGHPGEGRSHRHAIGHDRSEDRERGGEPNGNAHGHAKRPGPGREGSKQEPSTERGRRVDHAPST